MLESAVGNQCVACVADEWSNGYREREREMRRKKGGLVRVR